MELPPEPVQIDETTPSYLGERPPGASEFSAYLEESLSDRAAFLGNENLSHETPPLLSIPEELHQTAIRNAKLLRQLNGHRGSMLRKRMVGGGSDGAQHLQQLYDWSTQVLEGNTDTGILGQLPPESILTPEVTPEALYERLTFLEHHPDTDPHSFDSHVISESAKALGLPEKTVKWIDLISPIFNSSDPKPILEKLFKDVGYIPGELTTRKAFQKIPAPALIKVVDALRELEGGEYGDEARHERARLLNAMIAGGNLVPFKQQGGNITLDANGIFINAGALHAHLPYGLIEERTERALVRDEWTSSEGLAELTIRSLEENNAVTEERSQEEDQLALFRERFELQNTTLSEIANQIAEDPEKIAMKVVGGGHILPKMVIDALVARGAEGISALARFGEEIGVAITDHDNGNVEYRWKNLYNYNSHRLLHQAEREYEERAKIINDPRYYNAYRSMRAVVDAAPRMKDQDEFIALRGAYKRARNGDQHSFVEIFHKGDASRILINEDKHLAGTTKANFNALPLYEREQYEDLERVLDSYTHFHDCVKTLESFPGYYINENDNWTAHMNYRDAIEQVLYFILAHSSPSLRTKSEAEAKKFFEDKEAIYERRHRLQFLERKQKQQIESATSGVTANSPESPVEDIPPFMQTFDPVALHEIVKQADDEYRTLLYRSIGSQTNFVENFMPNVVKTDIAFGPEFAQQARKHTASWGHDEELSRQPSTTRIVRIDHKEKGVMPFHIEVAALDALRLPKSRPFLNVIGGARQMESGSIDTLGEMSSSVLSVAHKHKMNVAVPGTQSGIGITFGRENLKYKAATDHLPHADKAHLFAVSPGGNTYYPGNPYITGNNPENTYAISPVDSIITPFHVNWGAKGEEKRNSPYINHVEYMEALYARIAANQRKLTVIGNGGLFATMEITEASKHGFDMFFIEDSGRLAQIVSAMLIGRYANYFKNSDSLDTDEGCYRAVMEALEKVPIEVRDEFISKDFGKNQNPENADFTVYREYFYRMIRKLNGRSRERILPVPLASLEDALDQYFTVEINNESRYPIREIFLGSDRKDFEVE